MPPTASPNVLLLFPDQWRADWLGCAGLAGLRTPVIDSLAARGLRLTHCMTPSPLCAPARAALALGCDYDQCGVVDNSMNLPLDRPNFYQHLNQAGYAVGGVGKFDLAKALHHHGTDGTRLLKEWGFTHGCDSEGKWDGVRQMKQSPPGGPYGRFLHAQGLQEMYIQDMENRRGEKKLNYHNTAPSPLPAEAYGDNWIAAQATDVLQRFPQGQPWFLQVNFTGPHEPMDWPAWIQPAVTDDQLPLPAGAPPHDLAQHRKIQRAYAAMLENIDALCGKILQAVAQRGELANTLVIFSSDHGEMLGDHGKWGKSTWEAGSVYVPLILAGPGVTPGAVSPALVQLQDLAPTILQQAQAKPLPGSAQSFAGLMQNPAGTHRKQLTSALHDWVCVQDDAGLRRMR